ncbi:hypothetical protein [Micromonospora sp. NPDC003776]
MTSSRRSQFGAVDPGGVGHQDEGPGPGPQPLAPAPGRPRRRVAILVAGILVPVLLVAAGAAVYLAAGWHDRGTFRAEPPACATLEPSLHLLATPYTVQQDGSNNCDLFLPRDHPGYISAPVMTVAYYVATPERGDAPEAASRVLRQPGAQLRPLSGVGDEAYSRNRSVYLRVSNLVVGIEVFPRAVSLESQVHAFAADLASRLGRN